MRSNLDLVAHAATLPRLIVSPPILELVLASNTRSSKLKLSTLRTALGPLLEAAPDDETRRRIALHAVWPRVVDLALTRPEKRAEQFRLARALVPKIWGDTK